GVVGVDVITDAHWFAERNWFQAAKVAAVPFERGDRAETDSLRRAASDPRATRVTGVRHAQQRAAPAADELDLAAPDLPGINRLLGGESRIDSLIEQRPPGLEHDSRLDQARVRPGVKQFPPAPQGCRFFAQYVSLHEFQFEQRSTVRRGDRERILIRR